MTMAQHAHHSSTRFIDWFVINCTVIHVIDHIAQLSPCPPHPLTGLLPAPCSALHNLRLVHHQLYHYPCHSLHHTAPSTSPTSSHAGLPPAPFHSLDPTHHNRQPEVTHPRAMTSWCSQTPMTNAVPQGPNVKHHPKAHSHVHAVHTHSLGREGTQGHVWGHEATTTTDSKVHCHGTTCKFSDISSCIT